MPVTGVSLAYPAIWRPLWRRQSYAATMVAQQEMRGWPGQARAMTSFVVGVNLRVGQRRLLAAIELNWARIGLQRDDLLWRWGRAAAAESSIASVW